MFGLSIEAVISIAVSFIIDFLVFLVSFLKNRKFKRDCLADLNFKDDFINRLYYLPSLISRANSLYPVHGDGESRLKYVLNSFYKDSFAESDFHDYDLVFDMIHDILCCDKFNKLPRDTQVDEPKKENIYEKKNNEKAQRQADFFTNSGSDEKHEPFTNFIQRRN